MKNGSPSGQPKNTPDEQYHFKNSIFRRGIRHKLFLRAILSPRCASSEVLDLGDLIEPLHFTLGYTENEINMEKTINDQAHAT